MPKFILFSSCALLCNSGIGFPQEHFANLSTHCSELILMHNATLDNDRELIDILIRYGNNSQGLPALHYAINMEDDRAVELLLRNGADPQALPTALASLYNSNNPLSCDSRDPIFPLDFAAMKGNIRIAQLLIKYGANINQHNLGEIYLWTSFYSVYRESSPLYFAAQAGQEEMVLFLIANGAQIEMQPNPFTGNIDQTFNPLTIANTNGHVNVLRILIENGAIYAPLVTASPFLLHSAASFGHGKIVTLFLEKGVYVDIIMGDGYTPLMQSNGTCFEILLKAGANPKAKNIHGNDALYIASQRGDIGAAKVLLRHGVDINALRQNSYPGTPFQAAFERWCSTEQGNDRYKEYLLFLLDNGSDINASCNGQTALARVKATKKNEFISWLIQHGARE